MTRAFLVWIHTLRGPSPQIVFDRIDQDLKRRALSIVELTERDWLLAMPRGRETKLDALVRRHPAPVPIAVE